MNYNTWLIKNLEQLTINYKSRDITSTFEHFCECVFVSINNKYCWLPVEYTTGIINKEK